MRTQCVTDVNNRVYHATDAVHLTYSTRYTTSLEKQSARKLRQAHFFKFEELPLQTRRVGAQLPTRHESPSSKRLWLWGGNKPVRLMPN